jgi:hypothetical protein
VVTYASYRSALIGAATPLSVRRTAEQSYECTVFHRYLGLEHSLPAGKPGIQARRQNNVNEDGFT